MTRASLHNFIRKYWWAVLFLVALAILEVWVVVMRIHSERVEAYAAADTLSEIAFYDAADPDLYVHILANSEFNTGGFSDYSADLLHPSEDADADTDAEDDAEDADVDDAGDGDAEAPAGDGITHQQMLYLFLPYEQDSKDWCLGLAEGLGLVIDDTTYHSGDRITGLVEGTVYAMSIVDGDGTVLERGPVTVRYNGAVPVLFCNTEDTEEYNNIRFVKYTDVNVDWFCLDAKGQADSYGTAAMSGHGNSTYDYGHKKPLNLRLDTAQSILGMSAVEKYVLLSNQMDYSNIKDKIVYEAAERMELPYTPACEFVCYYVNGEYEGLYLLSQKVDIGKGSITGEHDLDSDAKDLNSEYPSFSVDYDDLDTDIWYSYFDIANTPVDYSGAYLLELTMKGTRSDYMDAEDHTPEVDGAWIRTNVLELRVRSPRYASKTEVSYIRDIMLEVEAALYADDGVNPGTGKSYKEYFDTDSWGALVLLEDFFALQDYSMGSIFVLKRQGDDLLYAGPVWDYDKAMTDDFYHAEEETFAIDGQTGLVYWMYQLSIRDEIRERMRSLYVDQLSDIMMQMIGEDIPAWIEEISAAAATDNLRWGADESQAATWAARVQEWCVGRTAYFNGVWVDGSIEDPNDRIYGRMVDHHGDPITSIWDS